MKRVHGGLAALGVLCLTVGIVQGLHTREPQVREQATLIESTPRAKVGQQGTAMERWASSELSEAIRALDHHAHVNRDRCMSAKGFPQFASIPEQVPAAHERTALNIAPLEIGPSTAQEARSWGMAGASLSFTPGGPATVIPVSQEFTEADKLCLKETDHLQELSGKAVGIVNSMRRELRNDVIPLLNPLLTARLACVRERGYASLDPSEWLTGKPVEELLANLGIEVGRPNPAAETSWTENASFRVAEPSAPPKYRPTPAETSFALVFAACGRAIDFQRQLASLVAPVRSAVVAEHLGELTWLREELDSVDD